MDIFSVLSGVGETAQVFLLPAVTVIFYCRLPCHAVLCLCCRRRQSSQSRVRGDRGVSL